MPRSSNATRPLPAGSVRVIQRARKANGDATEALIERMHSAMLSLGIARMRKIPTPMRIVGGKAPRFTAVFAKPSGVDFVGHTLTSPSRPVYVEVKRVSAWRLPFSRIEPQQREELESVTRSNGIAIVLVVVDGRDVCAVPWHAIEAAEADGMKSLDERELWACRVNGWDYLAGWQEGPQRDVMPRRAAKGAVRG
jgi:penicillin-binding protein-related factor A (putative recombinase)